MMQVNNMKTWLVAAALSGLAGQAVAQGTGSATLDAVRARGQLNCGVSGEIHGFSFIGSNGEMQGLDADGCRAIAAATLGDAAKTHFVPLSPQARFTALQSGEVDVLLMNTTWYLSRESRLGLTFASVNFWDGTGVIVKAANGVKHVTELNGATICVRPATNTELDLADWARSANVSYSPVQISGVTEMQQAFLSGRCDAFASDMSQLAGFRYAQGAKAADLAILPEQISAGPSGAVVRKGDDRWMDIVRWTHFAQVTAENLGVGQANIDSSTSGSTNPDIRRLVGLEGDLGTSLGLDNKWAYNAIKQVGNYGDMYDRWIAPEGLARGTNALWTKGGLQYAPPLR
jgi:general L-amino acid transport system substrate-binding protein